AVGPRHVDGLLALEAGLRAEVRDQVGVVQPVSVGPREPVRAWCRAERQGWVTARHEAVLVVLRERPDRADLRLARVRGDGRIWIAEAVAGRPPCICRLGRGLTAKARSRAFWWVPWFWTGRPALAKMAHRPVRPPAGLAAP